MWRELILQSLSVLELDKDVGLDVGASRLILAVSDSPFPLTWGLLAPSSLVEASGMLCVHLEASSHSEMQADPAELLQHFLRALFCALLEFGKIPFNYLCCSL